MHKLRIALFVVVALGFALREVYWRNFAGNTVHVFADDAQVMVHVDDETPRTIAPYGETVFELEQGQHTLTLTSQGLTETRTLVAEDNEHLLTAPPGRCVVEVDVTRVVYNNEHIALTPQVIHPPDAFATHSFATGRTMSDLPESVDRGVGVILTVLMPCTDTGNNEAVQSAIYSALGR